MPGHPHNYTKPGLGPLPPNVFVPDCNDPTLGRSPHAQYELWGLAEDDEVVMLQLIPALVVFVLAVLDLQLRTPALSPVREHRECQMSITAILPSLVWRTINWCTCCLWIVMELWGRAIDIPEVVFLMHCAGDCVEGDIVGQDCTPGGPPRVRELGDLAQRQIRLTHSKKIVQNVVDVIERHYTPAANAIASAQKNADAAASAAKAALSGAAPTQKSADERRGAVAASLLELAAVEPVEAAGLAAAAQADDSKSSSEQTGSLILQTLTKLEQKFDQQGLMLGEEKDVVKRDFEEKKLHLVTAYNET